MAAESGIATLNLVWRSPEDMPTPAELDDPPPGRRAWARPRASRRLCLAVNPGSHVTPAARRVYLHVDAV